MDVAALHSIWRLLKFLTHPQTGCWLMFVVFPARVPHRGLSGTGIDGWLEGDFNRLHTWPERLGYVTGPSGHPHEPVARWLAPRFGIPQLLYCYCTVVHHPITVLLLYCCTPFTGWTHWPVYSRQQPPACLWFGLELAHPSKPSTNHWAGGSLFAGLWINFRKTLNKNSLCENCHVLIMRC
jgi:hypothetical protein